MPTWKIDNQHDLDAIARECDLHRQTIVDRLVMLGISTDDSNAFADFIINEIAIEQDGETDTTSSDDLLTESQFDRLSC